MQKTILFLLLFSIDESIAAKIDYTDVLNHCESTTHAQWVKKYDSAEDQLILEMEKDSKLISGNAEFVEVVFPQDLPKDYPMKGAFVFCYEIFSDFLKAKNAKHRTAGILRLESCYQEAYKTEPPKVLGQYLDCLKKIKN